jgi:hypothetical protein
MKQADFLIRRKCGSLRIGSQRQLRQEATCSANDSEVIPQFPIELLRRLTMNNIVSICRAECLPHTPTRSAGDLASNRSWAQSNLSRIPSAAASNVFRLQSRPSARSFHDALENWSFTALALLLLTNVDKMRRSGRRVIDADQRPFVFP